MPTRLRSLNHMRWLQWFLILVQGYISAITSAVNAWRSGQVVI